MASTPFGTGTGHHVSGQRRKPLAARDMKGLRSVGAHAGVGVTSSAVDFAQRFRSATIALHRLRAFRDLPGPGSDTTNHRPTHH